MTSEVKEVDRMDPVKVKLDDPPYSRLFIVCSKNTTEGDLRSAFQKYGTIEQIWIVRDPVTKEPKGITYIKFSKTSEAAMALKEMNGCCISSQSKPLNIRIAQSRDHGSKHQVNEEETLLRLFCIVPKSTTDQMLHDHFKQFGELDYVSVVKDRETKDSKGVAYVKFHKFLHAAKAFEECDRLYKAVFAKPKTQKNPLETFEPVSGQSAMMGYGPVFSPFSTNDSSLVSREGFRALKVIAPPSLSQNNLWRLFDLIPGLNFLKLDTKSRPGHAIAMYNSPEAAAYALKKLHGFEYPPGQRLIVKLELDRHHSSFPLPHLYRGVSMGREPYTSSTAPRLPLSGDLQATPRHLALKTHLATLAKEIAQAESILQSAGLAPGRARSAYESLYKSVNLPGSQSSYPLDTEIVEREDAMEIDSYSTAATVRLSTNVDHPTAAPPNSALQTNSDAITEAIAQATSIIQGLVQGITHETNNTSYSSVSLPGPQPFAPAEAETAERLFVVCSPQPLPTYVMRDVFSRFGNLVNVHMLNGKNYGYVKYASKESAEQAIQTLHGKEICGILIKVKTADPPGNTSRKRIRVIDD